MSHKLTLKSTEPVTHDTHHLVFDRPENYGFEPGQATDFALDRDGWRDEQRPFTFTGDPSDDSRLEFVIKSYPDHDGVTKQIPELSPGDTVLIDDAWGAIIDQGPGVFIAGGAGITPFIAILRERARTPNGLDGCTLIFSNSTERDIILKDEWQGMDGLSVIFTLTDEPSDRYVTGRIDGDFLDRHIRDFGTNFYVCGPPPMVDDVGAALKERGVDDDHLVTEES